MTLDQFKLDGRVALVTGASTGLGGAIARALAEAGAQVCCHGKTYTSAQAITGALSDPETPKRLAGAAVFLSSSASDYINGHVRVVDGGWMGR